MFWTNYEATKLWNLCGEVHSGGSIRSSTPMNKGTGLDNSINALDVSSYATCQTGFSYGFGELQMRRAVKTVIGGSMFGQVGPAI